MKYIRIILLLLWQIPEIIYQFFTEGKPSRLGIWIYYDLNKK
jgi:hypothetical protein